MRKKLFLLLLLFLLIGCEETILHDLSEHQANRAFVVLSRAGIDSHKVANGLNWSIRVSKQQSSDALSALEASRLFSAESKPNGTAGFGLIQSAEQRAYAIQESLSQRVEDTLKQMPGVLDARVHLFRAKRGLLEAPEEAQAGSASVLLIVDQGISPKQEAIKSLVAGALGLLPTTVSIVISQSEATDLSEKENQQIAVSEQEIAVTSEIVELDNEQSLISKNTFVNMVPVAVVALVFIVSIYLFAYFKRRLDTTASDDPADQVEPLSKLTTKEVF